MKYLFWPECRKNTCKNLTNRISGVALGQYDSFDLICIIVEVFILPVKNAIVWISMKIMRGHSCFGSNFEGVF